MATIAHARSRALTHAGRGLISGLGGGVVFGALMAVTAMLPIVAMLVGSESAAVGAVVHLATSAAIGLGFGVLAGAVADRVRTVLPAGLLCGVVWWVLGALVLMPAFPGMPLFMLGPPAMMRLMGHAVYGLVTAAILFGLSRTHV
ncbi:hypothetical protein [Nocardiopsis baichengensis]|uniref:hypothetical protein n=1 Tax=Nocardiopsis baichengensis TaxID=280240 RepID=UPI000477FA6E|nr:hypothetical protein [Nocardiopsis baichengensis]